LEGRTQLTFEAICATVSPYHRPIECSQGVSDIVLLATLHAIGRPNNVPERIQARTATKSSKSFVELRNGCGVVTGGTPRNIRKPPLQGWAPYGYHSLLPDNRICT
jgi:hypothetical protein